MKHVSDEMLAKAINTMDCDVFDTHAVEQLVLRNESASVARQILEHEHNEDTLQQFSATFSRRIGEAFPGQVEKIEKVESPNLAGRVCNNQQWRRIVPAVRAR